VRLYLGVVNNLAGLEISTIVTANVDILHTSFCASSHDVTNCALIVARDTEQ
jgi:hypothetical protein